MTNQSAHWRLKRKRGGGREKERRETGLGRGTKDGVGEGKNIITRAHSGTVGGRMHVCNLVAIRHLNPKEEEEEERKKGRRGESTYSNRYLFINYLG